MNNSIKFIENLNINNKTIIAAISGGPDSMYLLELLLSLQEKLNINIIVAHVHHNIRKESDEEARLLEEYCKKHNLIFEFKKIENYPDNKFSEEKARKIRYDFFDDVIKKYNSDILFTAHHGDDLIETILMRLIRGSTIKGYAGIKMISNDRGYKIARPLIYLTKEKIIDYLDKNGIWYAKDMSNNNEKYTRNRYRKKILPELKKENKNVHYKFLDYSEKLLLADEYLNKEADKFLLNKNIIETLEFNKLDKIIKIYVLDKFLNNIYKENVKYINDRHVSVILNYIEKNINVEFDLPNYKKGIIEYNCFKIVDTVKKENYEYIFNDNVKLPNKKCISIDNFTKLTTNYVIHLNSSEIKLPFHVRNKRPGDRMVVKNMNGSKKVSDIFTDFKLPKELRDTYPIVTDDTGEIIWIPGIKKSHLDRKNDKKYDIILKYD